MRNSICETVLWNLIQKESWTIFYFKTAYNIWSYKVGVYFIENGFVDQIQSTPMEKACQVFKDLI